MRQRGGDGPSISHICAEGRWGTARLDELWDEVWERGNLCYQRYPNSWLMVGRSSVAGMGWCILDRKYRGLGRLGHRNWTRREGAFAPCAVLPASRLTMYSYIDVLITLQVCNCPSFEKGSEVRMIDMACVAAGMVFCTRDGFLQVKPSSDSDVVPGRL
jgi:hypothetical protein